MYQFLFFFLTLFLLQPVQSSTLQRHSQVNVLGNGFSSDQQESLTLSCLNPTRIYKTDSSNSELTLGGVQSFAELMKILETSVDVSGSIDMFSLSARASYLRKIKKKSYSRTFYFTQKIVSDKTHLETGVFQDALNATGRKVYQTGPDVFRKICGDSFISMVRNGALLSAALNLEFNTALDKKVFDSHVSLGFTNILQASHKIHEVVSKYNLQGKIELVAFQEGGYPSRLAKILTKDDKGYFITRCSLDELSACDKVVEGILDYAEDDFVKQIDLNKEIDAIEYRTTNYAQLGLDSGESVVSPEIRKARQQLGEYYLQQVLVSNKLTHLLMHPRLNIEKTFAERLQQASANTRFNLQQLENPIVGAVSCYRQPHRCIETSNHLFSIQKPDDPVLMTELATGILVKYYGVFGNYEFYGAPVGVSRYMNVNPTVKYDAYDLTFHVSLSHDKSTATVQIDNGITLHLSKQNNGVYTGRTSPYKLKASMQFIQSPI